MRTKPHVAWALAGVLAAVGAVGAGIALWPDDDHSIVEASDEGSPSPAAAAMPTVSPTIPLPGAQQAGADDQFDAYFNEGIAFLREGRAHEALMSFYAASYLRPQVPDSYVNIGYCQIALGKPEDAAAAFNRALELNPSQANAYYGLAKALEATNRPEEALGAMRTFQHLLPRDETKFRRLASAAIEEWETRLQSRRNESQSEPANTTAPGSR